MIAHVKSILILVVATFAITVVAYPLVVLGIGQTVFRDSANGSLIAGADGTIHGSRLIAQPFKGDQWFQPRPSAVDFNASGSGGSNLGASNPKLKERVVEQLKSLPSDRGLIPADAVTTSGSGLDPHITAAYARLQVSRIAKARGVSEDVLASWIDRYAMTPLGGEPIVNVVELNRELDGQYPITSK